MNQTDLDIKKLEEDQDKIVDECFDNVIKCCMDTKLKGKQFPFCVYIIMFNKNFNVNAKAEVDSVPYPIMVFGIPNNIDLMNRDARIKLRVAVELEIMKAPYPVAGVFHIMDGEGTIVNNQDVNLNNLPKDKIEKIVNESIKKGEIKHMLVCNLEKPTGSYNKIYEYISLDEEETQIVFNQKPLLDRETDYVEGHDYSTSLQFLFTKGKK